MRPAESFRVSTLDTSPLCSSSLRALPTVVGLNLIFFARARSDWVGSRLSSALMIACFCSRVMCRRYTLAVFTSASASSKVPTNVIAFTSMPRSARARARARCQPVKDHVLEQHNGLALAERRDVGDELRVLDGLHLGDRERERVVLERRRVQHCTASAGGSSALPGACWSGLAALVPLSRDADWMSFVSGASSWFAALMITALPPTK